MLFRPGPHAITMATAKTGSFYLTETVTIPLNSLGGTRFQGVIDLGAYVSVSQGIAVAIESVDFIYQFSGDYGGAVMQMLQGNGSITVQLSDLNPGTQLIRADDQSLIASGALSIDSVNNLATHTQDLFPDNFGPSNLSEAFLVVNDSLYLVAGPDLSPSNLTTANYVTARIKCRVVKLSTKDWMAIAIQSTASDN